jgi:HTH-type transcriptional regulator/antitoxin HigA
MEQRGLTTTDLARVIGSRPRASEFMSGRRELSKDMIRRLVAAWGLPAEPLLGPPPRAAA